MEFLKTRGQDSLKSSLCRIVILLYIEGKSLKSLEVGRMA
jgi:hypothetical protein